jgi:hypothetical protein
LFGSLAFARNRANILETAGLDGFVGELTPLRGPASPEPAAKAESIPAVSQQAAVAVLKLSLSDDPGELKSLKERLGDARCSSDRWFMGCSSACGPYRRLTGSTFFALSFAGSGAAVSAWASAFLVLVFRPRMPVLPLLAAVLD